MLAIEDVFNNNKLSNQSEQQTIEYPTSNLKLLVLKLKQLDYNLNDNPYHVMRDKLLLVIIDVMIVQNIQELKQEIHTVVKISVLVVIY